MAKIKNYALLDHKAGVFLRPFTATNDGEAIRLLTTWVNDKEHNTNINKYPQDFSLHYLGEFDDQIGRFEQQEHNKEIILGISVQQEQERQYTVKELITMLEQHFENKTNPPLHEVK